MYLLYVALFLGISGLLTQLAGSAFLMFTGLVWLSGCWRERASITTKISWWFRGLAGAVLCLFGMGGLSDLLLMLAFSR